MILKVLFGQRIERYEGEHAPEALSVIDEYGEEENPGFLINELKKYEDQNVFENLIIVKIKINDYKLGSLLRPKNELGGKIID